MKKPRKRKTQKRTESKTKIRRVTIIENSLANGLLFIYPENEYLDSSYKKIVEHCKTISYQPYWVTINDIGLSCYYHKKKNRAMTILFFHGNGECVSDFLQFIDIFDSAGVNVFFVEYRGYGISNGKPSLSGILNDIKPIFESLKLPPERTIVYGRSLGSLCAIHATLLFPKIRGLIVESGIATFSEWQAFANYFKARDINKQYSQKIVFKNIDMHLDNKAALSEFSGSTLILHCRKDHNLSASNAEKLFDWANEPKRIVIFPQGDHGSIIQANSDSYQEEIKDFVKSLQRSESL
jgi:pimeloyl-ACP methyl ester carboxylesterase